MPVVTEAAVRKVLDDFRDHFDDVLAALEMVAGWHTERVQRPVHASHAARVSTE